MTATESNFIDPHFGNIPIACVIPSKTNPRKHFNESALQELAASIKQVGVAQPILVRPLPTTEEHIDCVEIVAGERRYRAAKLAGLTSIPAVCRDLTDAQVRKIQIIENLQRQDVHPIEEAEGYDQLMQEDGYTADQLAEEVGKSRSYIYGRLKFCSLAPSAREAFFEGKLSASTALLIARIPSDELQTKATQELTDEDDPLSYRQAVEFIQQRYMLDLTRAPFSLADAKLVSAAGSCKDCLKRTGNQPELFSDVKRADVCTDPDCFATKRIAHGQKAVAQAKKKGIPVYTEAEEKEADDLEEMVSAKDNLWCFDRRAIAESWKSVGDVLPSDQRPAPAAYVTLGNGEIREYYDKTAMQEALEKAGICETQEAVDARLAAADSGSDGKSAAKIAKMKEAEEKANRRTKIAEQETAARVKAYREVRERLKDGLTVEAWRLIATELLINYYPPVSELPDVYNWKRYDGGESAQVFIDSASASQLQVLILDMILAGSLELSTYNLTDDDEVDLEDDEYLPLAGICELCKVDIAAIRQELQAPPPEDPPQEPPPKNAGGKKSKSKAKANESEDEATDSTTVTNSNLVKADAPWPWPFPTGVRP